MSEDKIQKVSKAVETATRFGIESTLWSEVTEDAEKREEFINYKNSKVGKSRWV